MPVAYAIDRWFFTANITLGTYALGANGITFVSPSGAVQRLQQKFDGGGIFGGKTVTASVMLGDGTIVSGTAFRNAGTLQDIFNQDGMSTRFLNSGHFEVTIGPGQTKTIRAVKLELGSVSTLANDALPKKTELWTCQNYYTNYKNETTGGLAIASSINSAATYADFILTLPAPLRANPSVTIAGSATLFDPTQHYFTVSSITLIGRSNNEILIRANATGLTAGTSYRIALSAGAVLAFSADL